MPTGYSYLGPADVFIASVNTSALIKGAKPGDTTITLKNSADAGKFKANGWICVSGLSLMNYGYPPNIQYTEYHKVTAISGSTLTLDSALKETYLDTWPALSPPSGSGGDPNALGSQLGGPATAYALRDAWDGVFAVKALTITSPNATFYGGRETYNEDVFWNGQYGPCPTCAVKARLVNCTLHGHPKSIKCANTSNSTTAMATKS